MFLLKKILTPFLLPPGVFVALAFCMAAARIKKNRKQAMCWAGFAMLMWAAATRPAAYMALAGLEYAYLPPAEVRADAVVVLSGGIREGAPETFGGAALSGPSLERASEAARVYRRYKLPLVVTGGSAFSKEPEAAAIKKYLVSLGVPAGRILTEALARDTRENAVFSKKLCDEKGYKRIVLLTSAYHMRRSVWSFEHAGFKEIIPWPTAYNTSLKECRVWADYLPSSFEGLNKALHERLGLLFYRIID
jgi:uncharacterized SAM-binding protein YcdF (DUF218 family)